MHEMLFSHQQELGNGYLVEYANNLGLDISQFLQDISKKVYIDRINEDIQSGLYSGVTAAPALFGYRIAAKYPERVEALIVQNGNAYEEGLREFWEPLKAWWCGAKMIVEAAYAYKRDLQNLEFYLFDTGHFALEEESDAIANYIAQFLTSQLQPISI